MGEELQEQLQNKILWESPFDVPLLGPIHISESVAMTWFIMAIIMVLVLVLTRNLKLIPGKRQAFVEAAVTWMTNFFVGNMGKAGKRYVPYLSTVLIYLGVANMIGMFGFGMKPPTKDINVTVALAVMSIILIEASTFRAQGGLKGFLEVLHQADGTAGTAECDGDRNSAAVAVYAAFSVTFWAHSLSCS